MAKMCTGASDMHKFDKDVYRCKWYAQIR